MIKWSFRITISLLVLGVGLYLAGYRFLLPGYHGLYFTHKKYKTAVRKADHKRNQLSPTDTRQSAELLQKTLEKNLFPYWYGTIWGYNGTTQVPGRGRIACGYFVTTLLKDAGFKLNYKRLAQLPSEEMITRLVNEKYITRLNRVSMRKFVKTMIKEGNGLYLVGLDTHTGFLIVKGNDVHFIHSSGRFPFCVLKEEALTSKTLLESKYKICGKISEDAKLLKKWVNSERI